MKSIYSGSTRKVAYDKATRVGFYLYIKRRALEGPQGEEDDLDINEDSVWESYRRKHVMIQGMRKRLNKDDKGGQIIKDKVEFKKMCEFILGSKRLSTKTFKKAHKRLQGYNTLYQ